MSDNKIRFDDRIDKSIKVMINEMKKLGIKRPSKRLALTKIIEMNDYARIKIYRKKRSKKGLIFKIRRFKMR